MVLYNLLQLSLGWKTKLGFESLQTVHTKRNAEAL